MKVFPSNLYPQLPRCMVSHKTVTTAHPQLVLFSSTGALITSLVLRFFYLCENVLFVNECKQIDLNFIHHYI